MGRICVWIISLIAASLIGIVSGQGSCTICGKYTKDKNCTQEFHNAYPIDDMMCQSIANNKNIETSACANHKNGYRIICKTRNIDSTAEVLDRRCSIECPPPKVINERYYGSGVSRVLQPMSALSLVVVMVVTMTARLVLC